MKYLQSLSKLVFFKIHCLVFLFLLQGVNGADDTESWSSIGFETKLPYSIELELDQGLRLKDQISSFKQTFTQVSVAYEIIDGMKIFVPIRYAIFEDKTKQRISAGGSYKYDLKPLSFKIRSKFQMTFEENEPSRELVRNKFSIDYKINKKFKSYISGEVFHLYDLDQYQYDEYRISTGMNMSIKKKRQLKISYTYKLEDLTRSNTNQINIFGIGYNFKF